MQTQKSGLCYYSKGGRGRDAAGTKIRFVKFLLYFKKEKDLTGTEACLEARLFALEYWSLIQRIQSFFFFLK